MNSLCRIITVVCTVIFLLTGCSQGSNPTVSEIPEPVQSIGANSESSRSLMGLWSFVCDPYADSVEIIPLRDAALHLNALKFLEPPALVHLTMEGPPQFNGNILDIDIGLRNPYLGLDQFSGFDVCGIVFTHGSVSGFNDPEIVMAGKGDTRLVNADGYTRWWNPAEFPHVETIFGYKDGLLGTPAADTSFNCTINGYKYFADDLDKDAPVTSIDLEKRGMFRAGQQNVRHYKIDMGDELVFNYAVDANWKKPTGSPPYTVPDDFPPAANRPEAYFISVTELENSLESNGYNGTGSLNVQIDVWDHFDAEFNEVGAESLAGLPFTSSLTPIGGGEGFSSYQLDFTGTNVLQFGDAELLITVESEQSGYGGLLPGKPVCAYFSYTFDIAEMEPGDGWARTWGGISSTPEYGLSTASDQFDNCYVSGGTAGPTDFDPGPGIDLQNNGESFISKFNAQGEYQWARSWNSGWAWSVAADSMGSVYAVGTSGSFWLRKYNSVGDLQWIYEWDSGNGRRVAVDENDNLYVVGSIGSGDDLDPGPGVDLTPVNGACLIKFDSEGLYQWGRVWDASAPMGLSSFGLESVYAVGRFHGTADFDPGPEVDEHSANGGDDAFLVKYDSDGNFLWCRTWGGTSLEYAYRAYTGNNGGVCVGGCFTGNVDFDPGVGDDIHTAAGEYDAYVTRFDADGNFLWARTWGGESPSGSPFSDFCSSVGVDSMGNVYASGEFEMTVDFDPGPGVMEKTSAGLTDSYLLKFDSVGDFLWVRTWGDTQRDEVWGGTLSASGISYVTGGFTGTVDFDPGPGVTEYTSNGGLDVFVSKFPPDGNW